MFVAFINFVLFLSYIYHIKKPMGILWSIVDQAYLCKLISENCYIASKLKTWLGKSICLPLYFLFSLISIMFCWLFFDMLEEKEDLWLFGVEL